LHLRRVAGNAWRLRRGAALSTLATLATAATDATFTVTSGTTRAPRSASGTTTIAESAGRAADWEWQRGRGL
jgi:hypothetical protein